MDTVSKQEIPPERPLSPAEKDPGLGRIVMLIVILASFLASFAGSSLNVSIPSIGLEFQSALSLLGWIVTAYTVCTVALLLPIGRLADLTSKGVILIIGIVVLSVASLLTVFAYSLEYVIAMRALAGVGAVCMFSTQQAIIADVFPREVRGKMLGMSVSAVYVGLSLGPVIGGFLTHIFGWHGVFVFIAAFGLLTAVISIVKLPTKTRPRPPEGLLTSMDMIGIAMYSTAMLCLTLGLTNIALGPIPYFVIAAGIVLLALFIRHESRVEKPLVKPELFKNGPNFLLSNLSALLSYAATFAVSYLMAIYLQQIKGFGADIAGLILISAPAVQSIVTLYAGRLSDRYSAYTLASIGMGICVVGLAMFVFIDQNTPLAYIFAGLIVVGTGFGLFSAPNTNAIMSLAKPSDFGIAAAFVSTMRNLGMVISMSIITITVDTNLAGISIDDAPDTEIVWVMRLCFMIFAIICVVGVFASLNRKKS